MIRVFKLTNGISIIANIDESSSRTLYIRNVFMIERRMNEVGDVYEVLSCYTSYVKNKDDWIELSKNQIVFSYEPTEEFCKYYMKISDTYWSEMVPVMNKIVESYVTEPKPIQESQETETNVVPMKPSKTIH